MHKAQANDLSYLSSFKTVDFLRNRNLFTRVYFIQMNWFNILSMSFTNRRAATTVIFIARS